MIIDYIYIYENEVLDDVCLHGLTVLCLNHGFDGTYGELTFLWRDFTDGCLGGKYLVLSLFALRPPLSQTLCCKMYIQRVKVFTFYRYLYMQTRTGIKTFYHM